MEELREYFNKELENVIRDEEHNNYNEDYIRKKNQTAD